MYLILSSLRTFLGKHATLLSDYDFLFVSRRDEMSTRKIHRVTQRKRERIRGLSPSLISKASGPRTQDSRLRT